MPEPTPTTHELIVARLGRLERRLAYFERRDRRMKRAALACVLLFTCAGVMAQTTKKKPVAAPPPPPPPAAPALPKIIEAEGFILKDPSGKVRAELSLSGTGPSLKLRDVSGMPLVNIALNDAQPGGPFLLLSDAQHHASLNMSVLDGQGSQLALAGDRPDIQLRLGVGPSGTALELTDKDGFGATLGNTTALAKNGKTKPTSGASVVLFDKDRKTLWSTP